MKCPKCGAQNQENADFCNLCYCSFKLADQKVAKKPNTIDGSQISTQNPSINQNFVKTPNIAGIISLIVSLIGLYVTAFVINFTFGLIGVSLIINETDPFKTTQFGSMTKFFFIGSMIIIDLALSFSLAAIISGIVGIKQKYKKKGFSISGVVIGSIELLIIIIASTSLLFFEYNSPNPVVIKNYKIYTDNKLEASFKLPSNWQQFKGDTQGYDVYYRSPKYGITVATLRFFKGDGFETKEIDSSVTDYLIKKVTSNEPSLSFNFKRMIKVDGEPAFWFRYIANQKYKTKNSEYYHIKHVRESLVLVRHGSYYQIDLDYIGYESNFQFYEPAFTKVKKSLKFIE